MTEKKRIALIQGFADFHFEMLGYVIEYCLIRKDHIRFDVFITPSTTSSTYESVFNNVFSIDMTWKAISDLNHENYDFIFLLTDDDYHYKKLDSIAEKVIIVDHASYIRRHGNFLQRIGTRKRGEYLEVLPVFNGISQVEKMNFNKENGGDIHVCCIGVSNIPNNPIELIQWFGHSFAKVQFHFIARRFVCRDAFRNIQNVHFHENTDPFTYFNLLRKSSYVLCANTDMDYEKNLMSGALPIAFTFGCKLIIPPSWQKHLQYKSALTYNFNTCIDLTCPDVLSLDPVFEELVTLLAHRNETFDHILTLNV